MSFRTYPSPPQSPPSLDLIDRRLASQGADLGGIAATLEDMLDAALIYQKEQLTRVTKALKHQRATKIQKINHDKTRRAASQLR